MILIALQEDLGCAPWFVNRATLTVDMGTTTDLVPNGPRQIPRGTGQSVHPFWKERDQRRLRCRPSCETSFMAKQGKAGSAREGERSALAHELAQRLARQHGARLREVIVYGSTARRQARKDSDLDVLVVLDEVADLASEIKRISAESAPLSLEHDIVISVLPVSADDYQRSGLPIIERARREGIAA